MLIESRRIADLKPHPRNYRRHPPAQLLVLQESLRVHGFQKPVVVQPDGTILAGHGMVEAAEAEGHESVPVHVYDGPYPEAFLAVDNRASDLAEDDGQVLADLLKALAEDEGLQGTGYGDEDLGKLIAELQAAEPPQEEGAIPEPEPEGPTRVQPGEVWQLGKHRVMCGDSTDGGVVAELFGEGRARMVWTDPPYGVSYADKNEFLNSLDKGNRIQDPIAHDHMSEDDTETLVREALGVACAFSVPGAALYVACPAGTPLPHFIAAVAASGFEYRHSLAWVKQQFVLGRCDYHYKHETILYGWKTDAAHYFADDHTKHSVFEYDKPHQSKLHPTMKPVELVADMVPNSSRPGEIVYDPFLGSGTTLIAAEQTGRVAYGMEIMPRYCDVILSRWEAFTGGTAVRVDA